MGSPATLFAITSAISAGGSLYSGYQSRKAARNDIIRYQEEKKYAELRALQDENLRREQMEITLSNNRAIAGAAGILDDSRSFLAIQGDVRTNAIKDISNIRLNKNIALTKYDQSIINSKIESQSATFGAFTNAVTSGMNGWTYYKYYQPAKNTKKPATGIGPGESQARFGTTLGGSISKGRTF
jgi:hypothetical protein